jgi:hypothetical protein
MVPRALAAKVGEEGVEQASGTGVGEEGGGAGVEACKQGKTAGRF